MAAKVEGKTPKEIQVKEINMLWVTPKFQEIELNCEINSYACAELEQEQDGVSLTR